MTSDMSTTDSRFLVYGDWRSTFLIVDRIGSSIELVPHLFGANGRPTGQRGAYLWMRTGRAVLIPDAARALGQDRLDLPGVNAGDTAAKGPP